MFGVSDMRICLAHRYQTTKHEMVCHWPENEYSIGMYILISHASARVEATGGFGLSKFLLAIRGEKRSMPTVSKPRQKYWLRQVPTTTKNKMVAKHLQGGAQCRASHSPKKNPGFSRQDIELEPDSHLGAGACGVAPRRLHTGGVDGLRGFQFQSVSAVIIYNRCYSC